jgi:hypothetical protein
MKNLSANYGSISGLALCDRLNLRTSVVALGADRALSDVTPRNYGQAMRETTIEIGAEK